MRTLTTLEFKNYLNALEITQDENESYAEDGAGIVCRVSHNSDKYTIEELAVIDRVEYDLTDSQKQQIISYVDSAYQSGSEPFTYEDQVHALSLIY